MVSTCAQDKVSATSRKTRSRNDGQTLQILTDKPKPKSTRRKANPYSLVKQAVDDWDTVSYYIRLELYANETIAYENEWRE